MRKNKMIFFKTGRFIMRKGLFFSLLVLSILGGWKGDACGQFYENFGEDYMQQENLVDEVDMIAGEIKVIEANFPTRVSIRDPEIAEVSKVSEREIVVTAQMKGMTRLVFWDKVGKHEYLLKIFPTDTAYINDQVKQIIKDLELDNVYTKA
ncbi:MAG: hypothetical protein GF333_04675, partial [Candidatus Omnitrophica bacterium]|nr:hypothetical protein [Candidatus Omnitrophota bacterium]